MMEAVHITGVILHVLGAAIIIGGIFVSLLILVPDEIPIHNLRLLERIWRFLGPVLGIQFFTGLYLVLSEWDETAGNPYVWAKLILFIAGGTLGWRMIGTRLQKTLRTVGGEYASMPGSANWSLALLLLFMVIAALGVLLVESMHG